MGHVQACSFGDQAPCTDPRKTRSRNRREISLATGNLTRARSTSSAYSLWCSTMIESSITLGEYLRKIDADLDGDFLRQGVRLFA